MTKTPLDVLWNEHGELRARRIRAVGPTEIAMLLREENVRFVVADPGLPLRWLDDDQRFAFWKGEVRAHLAPVRSSISISLEEPPDGYVYLGLGVALGHARDGHPARTWTLTTNATASR